MVAGNYSQTPSGGHPSPSFIVLPPSLVLCLPKKRTLNPGFRPQKYRLCCRQSILRSTSPSGVGWRSALQGLKSRWTVVHHYEVSISTTRTMSTLARILLRSTKAMRQQRRLAECPNLARSLRPRPVRRTSGAAVTNVAINLGGTPPGSTVHYICSGLSYWFGSRCLFPGYGTCSNGQVTCPCSP